MASASTHSKLVRGTHEFHIVGAHRRKPFARVANSTIKSAAFRAGGHIWQLACRFDDKGELDSISLELLDTNVVKDVMAVANVRVEDPLGEWPPGVCPNDGANVFSPTTGSGRSCTLWEPRSKQVLDHERPYARDDRLTVHCTVDVLEVSATALETRKCFVSVVPPPTISGDLHKLLLLNESAPEVSQRCLQPDVTFVVQQTEIQAHKLVLAMRSPVFAAEFQSDMTEGTFLTVDNMAVSTFKAMLTFIYTDELTMKMKQSNEKYVDMSCETKELDLLVAADRYDLERLRIMCENILSESLDTTSVMATLVRVRGMYNCRQLENSCIEFIASDPDVYATVMKTEEYQELVKSCSPLIIEIVERAVRHSASRNSSSDGISRLQPEKSWWTYNDSEEVHGAHKFRIPNFCAVQKSHGVGESIKSGTFQVGGYDWIVVVYPSGEKANGEGQGNISVFLQLGNHPPAHGVKVSYSFKIFDPSGKSLRTICNEEPNRYTPAGEVWGYSGFITMESAEKKYIAHDGSLTIHCDVAVTEEPCTSRARAMIAVPESSIAMHLEQLLLSEQGSDVSFLVEGSMIHAHSLVIAARSPILYKAVSASVNNIVRIDDMKVATFKAILHFIYTDKLATLGSMVVAGDMLGVACRFDDVRMKAMCENFLADHISEDNALDTLKLARQHHCLNLEDYCMEFILSLPPQLAKDLMKKMRLN